MDQFKDRCKVLTTQYFVEGKETALVELLDVATMLYYSRLKRYTLSSEVLKEGKQELIVDLLGAAKSFDITQSDNFISYCFNRIKNHVFRTVTGHIYPLVNTKNHAVAKCTIAIRNNVSLEQAQKENKRITPSMMEDTRRLMTSSFVEDDELFNIEDKSEQDEYEQLSNKKIVNALNQSIDSLKERDQSMIRKMFFEKKTLMEIGEEEGVSYQAIASRFNVIYKRLRAKLEEYGISDCSDINLDYV